MKFEQLVQQIAEEFTDAWNQWDIERLRCLLTDDVMLFSPNVSVIYPHHFDNKLCGKESVISYWQTLSAMTGYFQVEQIDFIKEDRTIITQNKVIGENIMIKEMFTINEYGKIHWLHYEYSAMLPSVCSL
jgi:ketosteroid isomerase-like protein